MTDLVAMNTEWCHRLRVSGRRPLGRSMQQFISQQESSSSTHHSLELDLGQTGPGRVLLQRWHNHIDTCSPSAQAPSTSLALGLEQTQWRKGCILGCFWTEPQTPAQIAHSFTVIDQSIPWLTHNKSKSKCLKLSLSSHLHLLLFYLVSTLFLLVTKQ